MDEQYKCLIVRLFYIFEIVPIYIYIYIYIYILILLWQQGLDPNFSWYSDYTSAWIFEQGVAEINSFSCTFQLIAMMKVAGWNILKVIFMVTVYWESYRFTLRFRLSMSYPLSPYSICHDTGEEQKSISLSINIGKRFIQPSVKISN